MKYLLCSILLICISLCGCINQPYKVVKTLPETKIHDADLGIVNVTVENITQRGALIKWESIEPMCYGITWYTHCSDIFYSEIEGESSKYHQYLIKAYPERQTIIFVMHTMRDGIEYYGDGHYFDTLSCAECGNILEPPLLRDTSMYNFLMIRHY
jgi:hypothetical protein